jgi:hypothetical protein
MSRLGMLSILIMVACSGQNDSQDVEVGVSGYVTKGPSKQALISFDRLNHDFGTIIEGEMVVCYFDYENNGGSELVINAVEATCGCTTPDWSKEPLKPGEKESLKIIFNAKGRSGSQRKVVSVMSNASNPVVKLTLIANVKSSV